VTSLTIALFGRRREEVSEEESSCGSAGATLSHMDVSIRELRNRTGEVVAAVQAGEAVTLTSNGEPIADIVPHGRRTRWLPGGWLAGQLAERQADPALRSDLDRLVGETIDEA
jgi:prevent-host-death family protein